MTISAMRLTTPIKEYPPAALLEAVKAVATEEATVVAEEETVEEGWSGKGRARHSHRHVQRHLKHLDRDIRHALFDALKEAEGLDKETVKEIRGLSKEFRMDLKDLFHDAGRGRDFDPQAVLGGLAEAMREFTDGLVALRERYTAVQEDPVVDPLVDPVVDPVDPVEGKIRDEPGAVISVLA